MIPSYENKMSSTENTENAVSTRSEHLKKGKLTDTLGRGISMPKGGN
jgi:hypothetical protein